MAKIVPKDANLDYVPTVSLPIVQVSDAYELHTPHMAHALPLYRIITPLRAQLGQSEALNYSLGAGGHGRRRKWSITLLS